ncbi:hypothetical protein H2198_002146 [Neophaeococcomyces mojaviensis]|uniref:Uncharacterized protein n=1 Tax=Neophaeococcomyces mojaviensis TaxID=3383035 RepID=A0ACC3AFS0_9EURO|nr:hypothetical protein H2198_002146 [Knufia sp. JES_112]
MSAPSKNRRTEVEAKKGSPEASRSSLATPISSSNNARAFDPLPPPRDLYSRRDQVITGMNELRELYAKTQEVENRLPNNIVQEMRETMGIQWMRSSDHEECVHEETNIKTMRGLHEDNTRPGEGIVRMTERPRVHIAQQAATMGLNAQEGSRPNNAGGQKRRSGPDAETLLSKNMKTWRT